MVKFIEAMVWTIALLLIAILLLTIGVGHGFEYKRRNYPVVQMQKGWRGLPMSKNVEVCIPLHKFEGMFR